MNLRAFRNAGHFPTLFCAFLYFDVSFMIWVLLSPLAMTLIGQFFPQGPEEARADYMTRVAFAKDFMLALPLLAGAVLRLPLGAMADRWGGRRTAMLGMTLTAVPLLLGWLWVNSYGQVLVVGVLLGVAGASFAAALPLASRWYPPQYQGLVMGIAGAGNSGTALAALFVPVLLAWLGNWHVIFALALVPLLLTFTTFFLLARDSPTQPPPKPLSAYLAVLGHRDAWCFCVLYSVTFGGFVGLAAFLNSFFDGQYAVNARLAGVFTTLCVVSGSFLRPVGGYLADRFGGIRMLMILYAGAAVTMLGMAFLPPVAVALGLLFLGMGFLGMGNGSVFQLVPQRFPKEIGVVTGVVGAAGGVGGFFLPTVLGWLKSQVGTYGAGFAVFAALAVVCVVLLLLVRARWESTFLAALEPAAAPKPEPAAVPTVGAAN
jgi:NNP family nitrate/nitrite transporter-like MFS transporter